MSEKKSLEQLHYNPKKPTYFNGFQVHVSFASTFSVSDRDMLCFMDDFSLFRLYSIRSILASSCDQANRVLFAQTVYSIWHDQ